MIKRTLSLILISCLVITLVFSICLVKPNIASTEGLSLTDYFTINYQSDIDDTSVQAGESFTAHVVGDATCIQDSPVTIKQASIKSQVVAQSATTSVVLNSEYVINISPFPNTIGDSYSIDEYISLQFPVGSTPGVYDVVGKLIVAEILVSTYPDPIGISDFLPASQSMGSVTCLAIEPTPSLSPTPTPTSSYTPPSSSGGIVIITSPTPSQTTSPTPSPTTSPTPSTTPNPTITITTTPIPSPTQSSTPSLTTNPTLSPSPSLTPDVTSSPTLSQTPAITSSPISSATPGITPVSSDDSDFQWWWIVLGLIAFLIVLASVLWWRRKST